MNKTTDSRLYVCEVLNDEPHLITAVTTEYSGDVMCAILQSAYPCGVFTVDDTIPKRRLDEEDYDMFREYRYELTRPSPHVSLNKPKLIVIKGGKDNA